VTLLGLAIGVEYSIGSCLGGGRLRPAGGPGLELALDAGHTDYGSDPSISAW
jgi:hypothetical protein